MDVKTEETSSEVAETIPPLPPNRTVVDVFADFMAYLFQCAKTYIIESVPSGPDFWMSFEDRVEFVLTHPNGWEGAQQSQMRQAAIQAGLITDSPEGRAKVHFVTEGEASLHFCIQSPDLRKHVTNVRPNSKSTECVLTRKNTAQRRCNHRRCWWRNY